jgi:hypothetical protein
MTFEEFKTSLNASIPDNISVYLKSLWYDGKGDWEQSHDIIQDREDKNAAWIHAYLHRKEGDLWNADYWYRRAGKKRPEFSLEEEWKELVNAFIV